MKKQCHVQFYQKRIKCLRINLPKKEEDLYTENCKTLMKEIEEDTNNGKILCAHELEDVIL